MDVWCTVLADHTLLFLNINGLDTQLPLHNIYQIAATHTDTTGAKIRWATKRRTMATKWLTMTRAVLEQSISAPSYPTTPGQPPSQSGEIR
jgi:hypothetical protein